MIRRAGRALFRALFKEHVQALDEQLSRLLGIQAVLDERVAELKRRGELVGLTASDIYSVEMKLPLQTTLTVEDLCKAISETVPLNTKEFERYCIAEKLSNAIYPKYKFSEFGRDYLNDDDFLEFYKRVMDCGNWHSLDRKYLINQFLGLIEHLPGEYAECGVYRGATSYLLCRSAQAHRKHVHLFDSFKGLSKPGPYDGMYWAQGQFEVNSKDACDLLREFDCFTIHEGWIPDRFQDISDKAFCFVHIDVDLYQPTLSSIEFFYERVVPGGMILCDDYGFTTCPGAKNAIDAFFEDKPERVASLPTGQGLTIKR